MTMYGMSDAFTPPNVVPRHRTAQCLSSGVARDVPPGGSHDGCHAAACLTAASRADSGSQPSCDQTILPDAETSTSQGWS